MLPGEERVAHVGGGPPEVGVPAGEHTAGLRPQPVETGKVHGIVRPEPVAFGELTRVEHQGFVHLDDGRALPQHLDPGLDDQRRCSRT
jgi:hypothetical protein